MNLRIDYFKAAPDLLKPVIALDTATSKGLLDPRLVQLIKLRASQINGCAYCLRLHAEEARAAGVGQEILDVLSAWSETDHFSNAERAALAWTENLTEIASKGAPDYQYDQIRAFFDDRSCVQLTLLIGVINVWNRLAIGFASQINK